MRFLGLDIGGANIKLSDGESRSVSRPFDLWKSPHQLPDILKELVAPFGGVDAFAVTMTAELADCFATKAEGVDTILRHVESVADGKPVYVWQTGSEFVEPDVAKDIPLLVAAANWHALATWAGRMVPEGSAVLIDIGSTTADIIPLFDGVPVPIGMTDAERLMSGELVYRGVRRTPVCAVATSVPFQGNDCRLAAELFATMWDVYLLLGKLPEEADCFNTANGRPATLVEAHNRLAHMVCCDVAECSCSEVMKIASHIARVQFDELAKAMRAVVCRLDGPCKTVIASGEGRFLIEQLVANESGTSGAELVALADLLTPEAAQAACAFALCRLASERVAN